MFKNKNKIKFKINHVYNKKNTTLIMHIFCVRCRKKTETTGASTVRTKNGRCAVKGKCKACGTRKTQFVAGKKCGKMGSGKTKRKVHKAKKMKRKSHKGVGFTNIMSPNF